MEIKDKVVVITGGAKGIGRACAVELYKANAKIIIIDIDEENGKKIEGQLGKGCFFIKADVSSEKAVTDVKKIIMNKYNKIDILINNAAKQTENNFFEMSVKEFKDIIDTNLIGTFICSSVFGRDMKRGAKIINMLSVHYNKPRKNKYHYDASKAGIAMLTQEMALELANKGITVNGISYGACNTNMNLSWINNKAIVNKTLSKIPLKWIAEPEEIAKFTKIIIQEFSDYATGSIFNIDGGRSLTN